jgi:hypothetical protein
LNIELIDVLRVRDCCVFFNFAVFIRYIASQSGLRDANMNAFEIYERPPGLLLISPAGVQ